MDGSQFDSMLTLVTRSRRTVIGGSLALLAGSLGLHDAGAKKRRKKKCRSPKVRCGRRCLPAGACCTNAECGTCQVCAGNACVMAPAGTACGKGGRCNGTACVAEGSFGCTPPQDFCMTAAKAPCPTSTTPGAFCVVNNDDRVMCVTGGCVERGDQADCEAKLGPGAFEMEFYNECATLAPSKDGCFLPVSA